MRRPPGILKHVPQNCVRDARVVVAHPDVASPHLVLVCDSLDPLDQGVLRHGLVDQHLPVQLDVVRHCGVSQLVQVPEAQLDDILVSIWVGEDYGLPV